MIRQVYIGAAEYAAGDFVPLEHEIEDGAICEQLRHSAHGANLFSQYRSGIFELVDAAIHQSLASSGLNAADIDIVFLVSNMLDEQDNLDPLWLGELNARLNLSHAVHYHVGITGCGGFHWAARLAASLIASDQCNNILIVSFDKAGGKLQRLYGKGSNFPYVTGDAAASCIFSSRADNLDYLLIGKIVNLYDSKQLLKQSWNNELRCISRLFKSTYELAGVKASDIDFFIANNYSLEASRLYCQLANLSYPKAFTGTIATHAHCFSSDNMINLHHLTRSGDVRDGDRLLLFSTGPFQWGACVLQKISSTEGHK